MIKNEEKAPLMVSIWCLAYNHERYIRQCLNGIVMQKTNFRFEAIVHDDASTDGTASIIKEYAEKYPNIIKPIFEKENQYSKYDGSLERIMKENCIGKYIAFCEGDDYWTDSMKLKKQVDFLEINKEYSMCFHGAQILNEYNCEVGLKCLDIENRDYNPNELFESWIVPTASILERRRALFVKNIGEERILNGDIVLVLNCAKIGKIRGLNDVMSCYRVHAGGVTYDEKRKTSRFLRYPGHFEFIKDNYPFLEKKLVNKKIAHAYLGRRKVETSLIKWLRDIYMAFRYCPTVFIEKAKHK